MRSPNAKGADAQDEEDLNIGARLYQKGRMLQEEKAHFTKEELKKREDQEMQQHTFKP